MFKKNAHSLLKEFHVEDGIFASRKSMSKRAFKNEIDQMKELAKHDLAPTVYYYWIDKTSPVHYGFMVMQLCDDTAKGIILNRDLHDGELKLLLKTYLF